MPDQSCRTCGGELGFYISCTECRKTVQKICRRCKTPTNKQIHSKCEKLESIHNGGQQFLTQIVIKRATKNHKQSTFSFLAVGIIGLFILGFVTAAYFDLFHKASSYNGATKENMSKMDYSVVTSRQSFDNCLAYGSGESITVTCPTQYGYVYKTILDMPRDLATKFSDTVFSIRGISLVENYDRSVMLLYQKNLYRTTFFAS